MSKDREQKRKKKREENRRKAEQERARSARTEKLEFYRMGIQEAWMDERYQDVLSIGLKFLGLSPRDKLAYRQTLYSAELLGKHQAIWNLLLHAWKYDLPIYTQDAIRFFDLTRMFSKKEHQKVAIAMLKAILERPERFSDKCRVKDRKEVIRLLVSMGIEVQTTEAVPSRSSRQLKLSLPIEPAPQAPAALPKPPPPASGNTRPKTAAVKSTTPKQPNPFPPARHPQEPTPQPVAPPLPEVAEIPGPEVHYHIDIADESPQGLAFSAVSQRMFYLTLQAYRLGFYSSFEQLISTGAMSGVEHLWHQMETVRKVMRSFRGRAILADEVGLGKTIEACMVLKEYLLRGLVKSALILVPSSLVHQWQEELREKFHLEFVSSNDALFRENPDAFWASPYLLVSLQTARTQRRFEQVCSRSYDIVIVDEAHHLKNHTTQNWKLVNAIQKTFVLLLTATPVQNNLEELYNLVTLLKPGHLKTRKAFKEDFVSRKDPLNPINRERLRELLQEVMIRNTRSASAVRLPPRFATTVRVAASELETRFYEEVSNLVRETETKRKGSLNRMVLRKLLEALGSSHEAARSMIERLQQETADAQQQERMKQLLGMARAIGVSAKAQQVLQLVRSTTEPKIVFVNFLHTLAYLRSLFQTQGISFAEYQGGMNSQEKRDAVEAFRSGATRVLLATGSGGEGHNLQFCHVLINYDLPWNPMEIEQRIGRLHRIGQEKPVEVYNFCAADTIEDGILDILDKKINMFELVVGEIDMILGRMQDEQEFGDQVYEIWVAHPDEAERRKALQAFANKLKRARVAYESSKELDEKLFQNDFGI